MRLIKSTRGQKRLTRIYLSIKDLLLPTPSETWDAWCYRPTQDKH